MRRLVILIMMVEILGACSGLKRLSDYGEEQEMKKMYLEIQRKNFFYLKKEIEQGNITVGITKDFFVDKYGTPQIERVKKDSNIEELIYKPYTDINCSSAIYLYFYEGKLVSWDIRE